MNKGYKTELKPNNKQRSTLLQHAGASRFSYNWGLAQRIDLYEKHKSGAYKEDKKSTNAIEQHRELNKLKKTDFAWLYSVSKCAPQEALRDLDKAFKNFFRNIKQGKKPGFPKFKSKKKGIGSFRLTGSIQIESNRVKLPRIGWIKLKENNYLPISKPSQVTISERAGHWFISFNQEEVDNLQNLTDEIIGIDLGINHLATCSDNKVYDGSRSLKKNLIRLRRLNKSLSRKQKGSKNREKAKYKLSRLHYKISNIRKDMLHKITTEIVRTKPLKVVMENLKVSNMMKNGKLSRSIQDSSFYEFRRMMEYKLGWIGSELVLADTYYPSSKLCSRCGNKKKELSLCEREYRCEECGLVLDRDLNASYNLVNYAVSSTV